MTRSQEQAKIWRADAIPNSDLLHAHYIRQQFAPHMHDRLAIGVVESGAYTYWYRGANHVAGQGAIVCCNPGEVHTGQAVTAEGWRYRMFYLDLNVLQQLASQIADQAWHMPYFSATVIHDAVAANQLRVLHTVMERGEPRLIQDTQALIALATLLERHVDERPPLPRLGDERAPVTRAKEYIDDHFTHNITLDEIAAAAYLSSFHLVRVFRATIGLPPHAYLIQCRVNHARQLLAAGQSTAEAATNAGFFDQSHLTRHFRRMIGVTPGQYRRMVNP